MLSRSIYVCTYILIHLFELHSKKESWMEKEREKGTYTSYESIKRLPSLSFNRFLPLE